ncbi:23S rRNA pseudouridine(2604) synthase RluF [Paenibacillus periandrae]|uniref:23S rRNA pseudouridine(2604) synthase RluF n=1 Tax=Paenibacillus periandrae TaxID=1761741 RepID=UPI001F08D56F|nr:23S rRNA pseudouridine(2604) synthase RluF [Paenibacillus periandrae]
MRINKFISETGFCSRRAVDKLVEEQRVTINGKLAELGSQVQEGDQVCVDGRPVLAKKPPVYIALNKPVGITCTTELHIKGNIVDFVGHPERIFPIGRLDKDSEGLILLTNDGDIVNKILRAENDHEKEYIVTVDKPISTMFLQGMAGGVRILGTMTNPCTINQLETRTFRIILKQGLNRQIRRMCSALGYEVRKLKRVRIMNILLEGIGVGQWRDLTKQEMDELLQRIAYDRK